MDPARPMQNAKNAFRTGSLHGAEERAGRIDVLIQKAKARERKQSYAFDNAELW